MKDALWVNRSVTWNFYTIHCALVNFLESMKHGFNLRCRDILPFPPETFKTLYPEIGPNTLDLRRRAHARLRICSQSTKGEISRACEICNTIKTERDRRAQSLSLPPLVFIVASEGRDRDRRLPLKGWGVRAFPSPSTTVVERLQSITVAVERTFDKF